MDAKAAGIIVLALRCSAEWRLPFAKWQCIGLWPTFPSFIAAGAKVIAISCAAAASCLVSEDRRHRCLFLGRFAEMSGVEYQEKFRKATDRELPFCLGESESQTESSGTITEVSLTSCDKHADKHRVQKSKEYANGSCMARVIVLPIAIWPSLGPRTQTSGSVSCTAFRLGFGAACAGSG